VEQDVYEGEIKNLIPLAPFSQERRGQLNDIHCISLSLLREGLGRGKKKIKKKDTRQNAPFLTLV
jgi:hypothetical protein